MKNQYLADIGDYGKYGLLRFLSGKGIKIGVNWYLTEDDGTNDGKFKDYLDDPIKDWMKDKKLFKILKEVKDKNPTVETIEDIGLIPQAIYYSEALDYKGLVPCERQLKRDKWFSASLDKLYDAELVFLDPDNGISYSAKNTTKNNEKYVLPSEIREYYEKGKDVVFYCHKGRRKEPAWLKVKADLKIVVPEAYLVTLTYHKGTQRSYIFVIHPERYKKYIKLLREFTAKWSDTKEKSKVFDMEPICYSVDEFQTAYPTKEDREKALQSMNNEQIEQLVSTSTVVQGKIYYHSFKKENLS